MRISPMPEHIIDNYPITLKEAPPENIFQRLLTNIVELIYRISFKSLRNAWHIGKQNDLSKTFGNAWRPGSFVTKCPMPIGTVYLTADSNVIRAVLQNPRKEKKDI